MKYIEATENGRIASVGWGSHLPEGAIEIADDADVSALTHYVDEGEVVERPECPISVSTAPLVATFHGVPMGATLIVYGALTASIVQDDPDGAIEVTVPIAGTYKFAVDLFPEQPFKTMVTL